MKKQQADKGISPVSGGSKMETSLLDTRVSYYRGVLPKNRIGEKSLAEILEIIRTTPIPTEKRIRELKQKLSGLGEGTPEYEKTKDEYDALKEKLFGFTPSGICLNGRENKDVTSYTGLVVGDFDDLPDEAERERVIKVINEKSQHRVAVWRTISGNGVRALVFGQPDIKRHSENFHAAAEHLKALTGRDIDEQCKNVARLSFLAYDPKLSANKDAIPLPLPDKKDKAQAPLPVPAMGAAKLERLRAAIEARDGLGTIQWTTKDGKPVGYPELCPSGKKHKPKHVIIYLDGIPHLHCFSPKCEEAVTAYNEWLSATWTEIFFDHWRSRFFIRAANPEKWITVEAGGARSQLARLGVAQDNRSTLLHAVRLHNPVEYAGPLAGYKAGIYTIFGNQVLVTSSPMLIEPVRGRWMIVRKFFEGVWSAEQLPYLFGWLRLGYEALRSGKRRPGQALVMAGERDSGKSLTQKLITRVLGGRVAHPYQYMSGVTPFNADLFAAEHLIIEDQKASTEWHTRRKFGTALKDIVVNSEQRCHRKHSTPISLEPFWRLSVSVNEEDENICVLPSIDPDIEDKIILLRSRKRPMPMPTRTLAEYELFMATLLHELPAFLYYLTCEWKMPVSMLTGEGAARFGMAHFHHPDVLDSLNAMAPEFKLLKMIDTVLFPHSDKQQYAPLPLEMDAWAIERELKKSELSREAEKLLYWQNACGSLLGKLANKCPSRVRRKKLHAERLWVIAPPKNPPYESPF
jgi:hypothetical protein